MTDLARVRVEPDGEGVRVEVAGEVDASNADAVRAALESAVHPPALTVDLSRLEYLDSAGVRALFALAESAATRSADLTLLVHRASPIRRVLDVSGLSDAVRIAEPDGR